MRTDDVIAALQAVGVDSETILRAVSMLEKQKAERAKAATRERVARHRAKAEANVTHVTPVTVTRVTDPPAPLPPKDYQNPSPPLPPINQGSDAGAGARAGFPSWPSDAWEQFIDRYPNRRKLGGPRGAKAAFGLVAMRWAHRLRFEELLAGVDRYVASKPADENWMLPGTWLEDERWTDEAAPVVARKPGRQSGIGQLIEMSDAAVAAEREAQQGGSHVDRNRYPTGGAVTRPYSTVGAFRRTLDRGAA